ncbi:MAG: hypothetical protein ACI9LM_004629 [Alteromonadaceae bacterium]|jgi:hypothetical protein
MYQHKINNKNLKLYGAIETTPAGEQVKETINQVKT